MHTQLSGMTSLSRTSTVTTRDDDDDDDYDADSEHESSITSWGSTDVGIENAEDSDYSDLFWGEGEAGGWWEGDNDM
jgi:hypothetical protein